MKLRLRGKSNDVRDAVIKNTLILERFLEFDRLARISTEKADKMRPSVPVLAAQLRTLAVTGHLSGLVSANERDAALAAIEKVKL